jgi:DNA-binding transcriptional ArsR family regulator
MQDLTPYFRALADRKRLLIVRYLARHEEITVTELGRKLRLSQPLISWHLRMLRRAGLVKTRRAGRQVLCSLNLQTFRTCEQRLDRILGIDDAANDDDAEHQPLSLETARHS